MTAALSYAEAKASGLISGVQAQICDILAANGRPLTAGEVAALIPGRQLNSVSPRFAELEAKGAVKPAGIRRCEMTGKAAVIWALTGEAHPPEKSRQRGRSEAQAARIKALERELDAARRTITELRGRLARWGRPTDEERAARIRERAEQMHLRELDGWKKSEK